MILTGTAWLYEHTKVDFMLKGCLRAELFACKVLPCNGLSEKTPLVFWYKTTCHVTTKKFPAPPAGSLDGQCLCAHADAMIAWCRRLLAVLSGAKRTIFRCFQGGLIMTLLETSDFKAERYDALA